MKLTRQMEEEIISFTQELVRIPGFSGEEEGTATAVAQKMEKLGYDQVEKDRWGNIIGTIHGSAPGPTLLFDGHTDVVPIRSPDLWNHEPYGGEIADGKIWGRGTADMKGGLAAMVCAAAYADRQDIVGDILVSASIGEELLIGRALGKILEDHHADYVMIGEPTNLRLAIAEVGRTTVEITCRGLVAHSCRPELGDNAIYRAVDAISLIQKIPRREDAFLGKEVIELVEIRSKPSPGYGSVPDYCWLLWECRLHPGETQESFLDRFQNALEDFAGAEKIKLEIGTITLDCYTGERLEYKDFLGAWIAKEDEPFRRQVEDAINQTGIELVHWAIPGCTNANVSFGEMGIPSLIFGPGLIEHVHKPNEHIDIEELLLSAKAYGRMIELNGQYS